MTLAFDYLWPDSQFSSMRIARLMLCGLIVSLLWSSKSLTSLSLAQDPPKHYLFDSQMPPGAVSQHKMLMRQTLVDHVQAVRIVVPDQAHVAIYADGAFRGNESNSLLVGLTIGHVYRLKITHLPGRPGQEAFPSVEVGNRLYPPAGKELFSPVPIHIPMVDLEPALDGNLVTRVVFLENPQTAIAEEQTPDSQPYFDVSMGEDPLRVAEKFGRPMALVRTGSRIPDNEQLDRFGFGAPPVKWFDEQDSGGSGEAGRDASIAKGQAMAASHTKTSLGAPPLPQTSATFRVRQESPVQAPLPPWRDELLIDGGDRGLKVVVTDEWEVRGLDGEDTIGHFDTLDGRTIIDESNRVAIYAPRFAAIRRVDGVARAKFNQFTTGFRDQVGTESSRRSDFSSTTLQQLQLKSHKKTDLARGLEDRMRGLTADNTIGLKGINGRFKSFENFHLIRSGNIDNREKGRLAIAMDRARTWQNNLSAQSTDDSLKLIVVGDATAAQSTVHVKTEKGRPQLRLVKVASTDLARPGDEVEFTIRFDNVGDELIGNVTIIDKLTTRLAFVEGSAECSLEAVFSASPSDIQSQTLRWEIIDPLKVGKGGIIRFKCRVR